METRRAGIKSMAFEAVDELIRSGYVVLTEDDASIRSRMSVEMKTRNVKASSFWLPGHGRTYVRQIEKMGEDDA